MPRAPLKGAVAAVWMIAALLTRPEAAGAPTVPLEVAGMMVTAAGAWSALDRHGGRLTLHYDARTAPELSVRVVLQGSACADAPGVWRVRLLVDGREEATEVCSACDCRFTAAVSNGAHTLTARVTDGQACLVAHRQLLVRLVRDGPKRPGADFVPDEAPRAEAVLRDYLALHRRIVDPGTHAHTHTHTHTHTYMHTHIRTYTHTYI
jgi:hypothetical protein